LNRVSGPMAWPVDLIPAEEGGFIVNFPDLPNGWSQGETAGDALAQAADLLEEMILGRMAHDEDVPRPSPPKDRPVITLPAATAAMLEAYRAMRAAGLDKHQLAERLGWQPAQVMRLFDGRHASRLDQIEAALRALGRRLVVTSAAGSAPEEAHSAAPFVTPNARKSRINRSARQRRRRQTPSGRRRRDG
jgi:antitoxin HicB